MINEILSAVDDTTFGECIATYLEQQGINTIIIIIAFYSDEESWNDIIIACIPLAAKWKQLSGCMGLSYKTIKQIEKDNPGDSDNSWNEALMQWILRDYNTQKHGLPSWRTLLKTISRVDQPLFEKLAKEHQVKCRHVLCCNQ